MDTGVTEKILIAAISAVIGWFLRFIQDYLKDKKKIESDRLQEVISDIDSYTHKGITYWVSQPGREGEPILAAEIKALRSRIGYGLSAIANKRNIRSFWLLELRALNRSITDGDFESSRRTTEGSRVEKIQEASNKLRGLLVDNL